MSFQLEDTEYQCYWSFRYISMEIRYSTVGDITQEMTGTTESQGESAFSSIIPGDSSVYSSAEVEEETLPTGPRRSIRSTQGILQLDI